MLKLYSKSISCVAERPRLCLFDRLSTTDWGERVVHQQRERTRESYISSQREREREGTGERKERGKSLLSEEKENEIWGKKMRKEKCVRDGGKRELQGGKRDKYKKRRIVRERKKSERLK